MGPAVSDDTVFLCHNSADGNAVLKIAQGLREKQIQPWLDTWNLIPGEEFAAEIEEAMRSCAAIAVFIGPTGRSPWQNQELNRALNSSVQTGKRLIPVLLPDAQEELAGDFLKDREWVKFPAVDDPEALRRLVCGIRGEAPGPPVFVDDAPGPAFDDGCPYAGILRYDVRHWPFFFGRERATDRAVEKIEAVLKRSGASRLLAVLGASGSGKSSFARAGVVHALLAKYPEWRYVAFEPSSEPPARLAEELACLPFADRLGRQWSSGIALGEWAATAVPEKSRLILLVDQFEEVFTRCADEGIRKDFISQLLAAASHASGKCLVLLTLRMDYYEKCAPFTDLTALMADNQIALGPLDTLGLQAAIERPVRKQLWDVEPGLVASLVADCGADPPLPLLGIVLKQLWKKCRPIRRLTVAAYQSMTIQGAINELTKEIPAGEVDAALSLFSKLAIPSGKGKFLRRRAPILDVMPESVVEAKRLESLIARLAGPDFRLLTIRAEGGRALIEPAHEAIFASWTELRDRLNLDLAFLDWRQRMEADIQAWQKRPRSEACVSGERLNEAIGYLRQRRGDLTAVERAYIEGCKKRRDRRRAIAGSAGLAAVLAVAAVVTIVLLRADLAELESAARNQVAAGNPAGLVLAYEAAEHDQSAQTEELLQQAVQKFSEPLLESMATNPETNGFADVAMSADGRNVAVAANDGSVLRWQAPRKQQPGKPVWGADLGAPAAFSVAAPASRVALTEDGAVMAAGSGAAAGEMHVWNVATQTEAFAVEAAGAPVTALAIERDGSSLAAATADKRVVWRRKAGGTAGPDAFPIPARALDLALAGGGALLAAACDDTLARIFDASGREAGKAVQHQGVANYVAFDAAGKLLASGAKLAEAKVSTANGTVEATFQPKGSSVLATAFSSNGMVLATVSADNAVTVWDVQSGNPLRRFPLTEPVARIAISGNGKRLAGLLAPAAGRDGRPMPGRVRIYELDISELQRAALGAIALHDDIDCSAYPPAQAQCEKLRQEAAAK